MTNQEYPENKIVRTFVLFGGILGGSIFAICTIILDFFYRILIDDTSQFSTKITINLHLFTGLLGWAFATFIVGLMPTIIVSLWITAKRFYIENYCSYAILGIAGFLSTFLPSVLITFFIYSIGSPTTETLIVFFISLLVLSTLGGICSIILGHFTIPKKEIEK